jgi:hypothetical protein
MFRRMHDSTHAPSEPVGELQRWDKIEIEEKKGVKYIHKTFLLCRTKLIVCHIEQGIVSALHYMSTCNNQSPFEYTLVSQALMQDQGPKESQDSKAHQDHLVNR